MYELAIKKKARKLRGEGFTLKEILEKIPFLGKGTAQIQICDTKKLWRIRGFIDALSEK